MMQPLTVAIIWQWRRDNLGSLSGKSTSRLRPRIMALPSGKLMFLPAYMPLLKISFATITARSALYLSARDKLHARTSISRRIDRRRRCLHEQVQKYSRCTVTVHVHGAWKLMLFFKPFEPRPFQVLIHALAEL